MTQLYGQAPVAAVGLGADLYVLTLGPEKFNPSATSYPAVPATAIFPEPSASQPATATRPDSTDIAATLLAKPYWNLLAYHQGRWEQRATLGPVGDSAMTPDAGIPELALHYGKIIAAWADSDQHLVVRTLDASNPTALWSDPVISPVHVPTPRLSVFTIAPRAFVLWPQKNQPSENVVLLGGPLDPDGSLNPDQVSPPITLGSGVAGELTQSVAADVTGNSIMAVFTNEKGGLSSATFSAQGEPVKAPTPIKTKPAERPEANLLPSLILVMLVGLLAVSLWQWQQRQQHPQPPRRRAWRTSGCAYRALIDMGVAALAVVIITRIFDFPADPWAGLGDLWSDGFASWGNIFLSSGLMLTLGVYFVHVTVGELFWGRSIGKRICRLRVIAIDGSKPRRFPSGAQCHPPV